MNKIYRGNSLLKSSNTKTEYTKEQIQEIIKCKNDPIYFIENYVKIIHADKGLVNFELRDYQKEMVLSFHENRRTILATARRAGKSASVCGYILWYILFNEFKNVGILANKEKTSIELLSTIQKSYQYLPHWLQAGVIEWNKKTFKLDNGCEVMAESTSADAVRGFRLNFLFIDECAFISAWAQFSASVLPTITSGETTKLVLVSTPCGVNFFYSLWNEALKGTNGYNPIKVVWQQVPGNDEKWYKETLSLLNNDLEKFEQEYSVSFLGSSGTLIAGWKLKELTSQTPLTLNENLKIYKQKEDNHNYVIICDVSRGKGLDHSAFSVFDVTAMPYTQVATFRDNKTGVMDYAAIIFRIALQYNNASVLVEINDIGEAVGNSLQYEFEYENVLYTESAGRLGKRIATGYGSRGSDCGIRTTKSVKAIGCSVLKMLIEQNQLLVTDLETINELTTFSKKANSYEAEVGKNDDLVMGLVLFAWLTQDRFFKEMTDINTLNVLREQSDDDLNHSMSSIFIDDGSPIHEIEQKTGFFDERTLFNNFNIDFFGYD